MSEHLSAFDPVEYPESDGTPMGETGIHVDELIALRQMLKQRLHGRADVYVGANMFLYYEQGNPRAVVAPDVYVALGVPGEERRTYKLWVEKKPPVFVMEITSKKTWLEDTGNKKAVYARIGVAEYFLFDPECDYLEPPLQGYALADGEYRRIERTSDGGLTSRTLGIVLSVEENKLRCEDASSGQQLFRPEELIVVGELYGQAETRAASAETRAENAESEVERLRRELERLRR